MNMPARLPAGHVVPAADAVLPEAPSPGRTTDDEIWRKIKLSVILCVAYCVAIAALYRMWEDLKWLF